MARLVTTGFELKYGASPVDATTAPDGAGESGLGSNIVTSPVRTGSCSFKSDASASPMAQTFTFPAVTLGNDCFARAYLYVPTGSLPATRSNVMALGTAVGSCPFSVLMEPDGTLTLWAFASGAWTQQGSASAAISLDAWNMVDLRARVATGAIDQIEARLEGASFASGSSLAVTDSQLISFVLGWNRFTPTNTATGIFYADDVAVNDSSGASQSSWPGSGSVALLRPATDSAVGTGWTLGNTTATGGNAWQRLDGAPPDSAADLTTTADADQIRNATSNANVNYDATMTTYTAAGVSGTVNVVVPIIATGAPVTTSAKAGTVGVVSNPAIANVSLGAGGTAGAFWSGVAIGTYPTGNKWSFGTTTYAPTVTLGTAPVMRITQVTASTRIAIVTEMGIYVDYTPAIVIAPTPLVHQSVPFYPLPSRPS